MVERVLVIGATGKTGSALARRLREKGIDVRAATRTPRAAGDVRFDWVDPSTFGPALEGAEAVYLVAPTDTIEPLARMRPLLEQAVDGRRLVLLSSSALPKGGPMTGAVHAWLADHSRDFAVLRPSWFMQNFTTQHFAGIVETNAIHSATGNGRVAFIDAEDIADVAAAMLVDPEPLDGVDPILTGPQALSYDDVAEVISHASGRTIRHIKLTVGELARRYESYGLPSDYAETLAALDGEIAKGTQDRVTSEVERWTGGPPSDIATFLDVRRAVFRQAP